MTEVVPDDQNGKGLLSQIMDKANLPQVLGGAAGTTLAKLVGNSIEYPAAWLNRATQGVNDKTRAKSILSDAIANAAAEQAVTNPELIKRAVDAWLPRELQKQNNREGVAQKAIEELQRDPAPADAEQVDDDWLNNFSSYAEKASSEKMRDLWGKVLAGQIRKKNSYGLATLRFMAELDQYTAKLIERYFAEVFLPNCIVIRPEFNNSPALSQILHLQNSGLIAGSGLHMGVTLKSNDNGALYLLYTSKAILLKGAPLAEIRIPIVELTQVGLQVRSLVQPKTEDQMLHKISESLKFGPIEEVLIADSQEEDAKFKFGDFRQIWKR